MRSKFVLDTSFISSAYNKNDSNHSKSIEILSEIDSNSLIVIPAVVLLELCLFSSNDKFNKNLGILHFAETLSNEKFELTNSTVRAFKKFAEKTNLSITIIDYFVMYTSMVYSADLLTFDKKMIKAFNKIRDI